MREGNEKERDCSVSRINTYRVGVQSEKNFFTQELGVDLDYVSRVFMVKQMEYHREMYSKLEQVYHQCWPSEDQQQGMSLSLVTRQTRLEIIILLISKERILHRTISHHILYVYQFKQVGQVVIKTQKEPQNTI